MDWNKWLKLTEGYNQIPQSLIIQPQNNLDYTQLIQDYFTHVVDLKPDLDQNHKNQMLLAFNQNSYPDYVLINHPEKSQYTRSDLNPVWSCLQYTINTNHAIRLIVFNHAEKLDTQTSNLLLKTLEEPPTDTFFVLITNNYHKLLATIRSRCFYLPITCTNQLPNSKHHLNQALSASGENVDHLLSDQQTKEQLQHLLEAAKSFIHNQKNQHAASLNWEFKQQFINYSLSELNYFLSFLIYWYQQASLVHHQATISKIIQLRAQIPYLNIKLVYLNLIIACNYE